MEARIGDLVRVWTDVGSRKPIPLLAKIVDENGVIFTIRYLSESDDKIWRYEEDTYEVDDESIAEYLKTDDEANVGFAVLDDGFIKVDFDDDYVPSEEDDDDEDEEDELDPSEEDDEDEEVGYTDDEDDEDDPVDDED
jgi:hypothetical protein